MRYSQSHLVIALLLNATAAVQLKNKINPSKPTGLEPPPKDFQYDVPGQLHKPLVWENAVDEDDFMNFWNPDKKMDPYLYNNFAQQSITPLKQDGLVPPPKDYQYDRPGQPIKPLNFENRHEEDDLRNVYNPDKVPNPWIHSYHGSSLAQEQITPLRQDGLVPPPKDYQYDRPGQPIKPLNFENRHEEDDLRNVYNPDKVPNPWIHSYHGSSLAQNEITPLRQDGLVPPPKDYQYDRPGQPIKPLNFENRHEEDDLRNVYNPDKKPNPWLHSYHGSLA